MFLFGVAYVHGYAATIGWIGFSLKSDVMGRSLQRLAHASAIRKLMIRHRMSRNWSSLSSLLWSSLSSR